MASNGKRGEGGGQKRGEEMMENGERERERVMLCIMIRGEGWGVGNHFFRLGKISLLLEFW